MWEAIADAFVGGLLGLSTTSGWGVTFSFLITSPLVNEVAVALRQRVTLMKGSALGGGSRLKP